MKPLLSLLFSTVLITSIAQPYQHTFVFLNSRKDKPELPKKELDKIMEGHLANIQRLAKEGKLLVAGPFDGGGGIFIFNSTSEDEVKEWLRTDPGVQANRWRLEFFLYAPRIGSACAVDPTSEMVNYQFIRYTSTISKFNVQKSGETFKAHDDFIKEIAKTGNVVTEGIFANRDGGILVIKGEVDKNLIESDPAMTESLLAIDYKKLWVLKGSFCEAQ